MMNKVKATVVGVSLAVLITLSLGITAEANNDDYELLLSKVKSKNEVIKKNINKGESLRVLNKELREHKEKTMILKEENEQLKIKIEKKREAERKAKKEAERKKREEEKKAKQEKERKAKQEEERINKQRSKTNNNNSKSSSGGTHNVNKNGSKTLLGIFNATAYDDSPESQGKWVGTTATGIKPARGVVAVDPRVIPLGSRLYVESLDGSKDYGYCIAGDTGGAIKGNRIDLFYHTKSEVRNFGRRKVKVYILK